MGKTTVPYVKQPEKGVRRTKKNMSHGTYRCKRHPTSPRCKNA